MSKARNEVTFVIERTADLPHEAALVWGAIADPVAYFAWNPAAKLLASPRSLSREMRLGIDSPDLGKTDYVHRIDFAGRTVTHQIELRNRLLTIGRETHTWKVTGRPDGSPGSAIHQKMEVTLTSFVSRLLKGPLQSQFGRIFERNFRLVDQWLATNPPLLAERRPLLEGGS